MSKVEDVCFIRAKLKEDYVFDAIGNMGYRIITPYRGNSLPKRALREAWFRGGLKKDIWFNPEIKSIKENTIIVFDPLITNEFLLYLRRMFPDKKIILNYENRADKTINPDSVTDNSIEKCTYDDDDSERYNMHLRKGGYFDIYRIEKSQTPHNDILFVGRDKGRGDRLMEFERQLQEMGFKTEFHICADRQYLSKQKPYYKKLLTYPEYLEKARDSRAILNIMPEGQVSLTMRDWEVVFNGIKGITNCKSIKQFELYDPSRFFVLGEDDLAKLPDFLNETFLPVPEEKLRKYTFNEAIKRVACC